MQPSWLAKEVGKPTRCAASCQIARGELRAQFDAYIQYIHYTYHYDLRNKCIYDSYVTYTFCYHLDKENMPGELEAIVKLELQQSRT